MRMPSYNNDQLSDQQLKVGFWYLTHKTQLQKLGIVLLAFIAAASVLTALILLVQWIWHIPQTMRINEEVYNSSVIFESVALPEDPTVISAQAVRRDDSHVDILVHMINPNASWGGNEIIYKVLVGSSDAGQQTVSLAPNQEGYYSRMNVPYTGSGLPSVTVEIVDTKWKRIAPAGIIQPEWAVTDQVMRPIRAGEELSAKTELLFSLTNKSIYGFSEPQVVVIIKDTSGALAAIGSIQLEEIASLQTRDLSFKWPERLSPSFETTVHVTADVLNRENILSE